MRSLGRLVRGLSALFWGLPLALVVTVYVATNEWAQPRQMLAPIVVAALLFYGLHLLGDFQKGERIWRDALDRSKLLAVVNIGLSPFVYWYNRFPSMQFYSAAVFLLMITALLFLFNLNHVLQRLAAMLPDETLRIETRVFGNLNTSLLAAIVLVVGALQLLRQFSDYIPAALNNFLNAMDFIRTGLFVFLTLLPMAMTMTLIWKIKEVIFASVFTHEN
jgi:hypothetical protein